MEQTTISEVRSLAIGSITETQKQFLRKGTNKQIAEGIKDIIQTLNYYVNIKADNSFIQFALKYQEAKERNLMNVQSFDLSLNRRSAGRLIALSRLNKALN